MVANLKNLSQAVDRAAKASDRDNRLLRNEITKIQQDIDRQGYSEIEIDGKQFVVESTTREK